MKKLFGFAIVLLFAIIIIACEGEKILSEKTNDNGLIRIAPAEIHNSILKEYYSVYDFSNWESIIRYEFFKGTFHKDGVLDDNKIASYIWDNQSLFFDTTLYIQSIDKVNSLYNITMAQNYILPLPFDNFMRKMFWNMDNLADGYKLLQYRGTPSFHTEWERYLINEIPTLSATEREHMLLLYKTLQDQSLTSLQKENEVLLLNNLLDVSTVSSDFLSRLVFTENCVKFYAHSDIDFVMELKDIVSHDDAAGAGTYASLAVTCNSCNPEVSPYGITHAQHIEQSDYDGACASLSGDILATIKYIISHL